MGPTKGGIEKGLVRPVDKKQVPSEPTKNSKNPKNPKNPEPETHPHASKVNQNHETERKGKNNGKITKGPEKPKSSNKKVGFDGAGSQNQNVKWVLEDGKYFKRDGNKVTLVKRKYFRISYGTMAMLVEGEGGGGPVSGEHFWTVHFGGMRPGYSNYPFAGISSSRWCQEQLGLLYAGILSTYDGEPRADFGPRINSGDVISILCSFSQEDLKVYFYHNGRCLGLSFHVPASLFRPEGICPCVKLKNPGEWATIKKEPEGKIPKQVDRIRAPVDQFGVEGKWKLRNLVDSTSGKVIPLKIDLDLDLDIDIDIGERHVKRATETSLHNKDKMKKRMKKLRRNQLTIHGDHSDLFTWEIRLELAHFVDFKAEKGENNLWKKTVSIHDRFGPVVSDHTRFPDFPIVDVINQPDSVVLQDQEMRVSKGNRTAIFDLIYKMIKGDVFDPDFPDL